MGAAGVDSVRQQRVDAFGVVDLRTHECRSEDTHQPQMARRPQLVLLVSVEGVEHTWENRIDAVPFDVQLTFASNAIDRFEVILLPDAGGVAGMEHRIVK